MHARQIAKKTKDSVLTIGLRLDQYVFADGSSFPRVRNEDFPNWRQVIRPPKTAHAVVKFAVNIEYLAEAAKALNEKTVRITVYQHKNKDGELLVYDPIRIESNHSTVDESDCIVMPMRV